MASPIEYAEDQKPVLVAKKPCGCYAAALCLSPNLGIRGSAVQLEKFVEEFDGYDIHFEVRPLAFVRQGGLNVECRHPIRRRHQ